MAFIDDIIDQSKDLWEAAANERFPNEMADGTLPKEKFLDYIVQDSIYLRDYLKAFAFAMAKSADWEQMKLFYSMLGYVNDGENVTRLGYLAEVGLTDADVDRTPKRPQCANYTSFLIKVGQGGDVPDIVMAVMPCMLGYHYVFTKLLERAPQVAEGYFAPLVADYTSEGYAECCEYWKGIVNEMCEGFDANRKQELGAIFYQASLHELWFWQMAGEDR